MGYGVDTTKFPEKKWGNVITWTGDAKGKLEQALAAWEQATGVTFSKIAGGNANPDFTIKWTDKYTAWDNKDKNGVGNGRPPKGSIGELNLADNSTLGVILHELGHLLGLSHEQDNPAGGYQWLKDNKVPFGVEGAKGRAAKNKSYGNYEPGSIMHYPSANYNQAEKPTDGDASAAKEINGW